MVVSAAQYLVGIDLGTTHTVVSYLPVAETDRPENRKIFEIEQLVAAGEVARLPLLPSFRYHPLPEELSAEDCQLPWGNGLEPLLAGVPRGLIGAWARDLGASVDGRQVVSAKSWLSHPQVDRREPILPWDAASDVEKISPLHASASYLAYVRAAWNQQYPEALLEHQDVVITVPASFDEMARVLTVEAASLAGLKGIHLLEEPQAVCYDWLSRHRQDAAQALDESSLLLVCDVGGGTTDLSLIRIEDSTEGTPQFTRVAVGDHLMLGGDNVDLALAHLCENRLKPGKRLSAAQLSQLIQQTRQAKERLLSADPPASATVTLLGSGSRLIGGSKRCDLTQEDISTVALEGFVPLVDVSEGPQRRRSAVVEFGLPYASDPAISRHIAGFLQLQQSHLDSEQAEPGSVGLPDALLLNGGVFRSPRLTQRLQALLSEWRGNEGIRVLDNPHPDLAVAYGAVAYAMARRGSQPRIRAGAARAYYLMLDQDESESQAICLLARGTDEEQEVRLEGRQFLLTLDQPVRFDLAYSGSGRRCEAGELVQPDEGFLPLPPLVVALKAQDAAAEGQVKVELVCRLTEVGTLQLECQEVGSERRWKVEFQVREGGVSSQQADSAELPPGWDQARERLLLVFGQDKQKVDPKVVKGLRQELEKILGKRDQWDLPLLRAMFDVLLEGMEQRKRSQTHERVWLNLCGYCLRPGFGDPVDDWRVSKIWKLWHEGLHYDRETQSWIDWWTLWRRVAGGLGTEWQSDVYASIRHFLDPAANQSRKRQAEAKLKSYEDMVKLAGALEQLPQESRIELGNWFLKRLQKSSETPTSWWALGRIGSRVPFHGGIHNVVPASVAAEWLRALLKENWKKNTQAGFAAVMIARKSGDRSRDVSEEVRAEVIARLQQEKAPESWIHLVQATEAVSEQESRRIYGEALPSGLRLLAE